MITENKLLKFAELAVRIGVNMQKGQEVLINSDISTAEFARLLAEKAYEFGAKRVHINYRDEKLSRINFTHLSTEELCNVPQYEVDKTNNFVDKKCCLISISAGDPNIYQGLDAEKIAKANITARQANHRFYDSTMSNYLRWTIVSVPTEGWAKTIFPNIPVDEAMDKLWNNIASIMRLNEADPTQAWLDHIAKLHHRAEVLNENNFKAIKYSNSKGTDIVVGLADDHKWIAAQEEGQDGVMFTANMPTEEIFTAPHNKNINGTVYSALPLVNNGNIVDDFYITFKDGVVVDYDAKVGKETLKGIIDADDGAKSLGEIALLDKHSPIAQSGVLFYNTMFDENASCHLALGKAYPTTVKGGNDMTEEELAAHGVNTSVMHVDFMVGTSDLKLEGIRHDGTTMIIMEDCTWKI